MSRLLPNGSPWLSNVCRRLRTPRAGLRTSSCRLFQRLLRRPRRGRAGLSPLLRPSFRSPPPISISPPPTSDPFKVPRDRPERNAPCLPSTGPSTAPLAQASPPLTQRAFLQVTLLSPSRPSLSLSAQDSEASLQNLRWAVGLPCTSSRYVPPPHSEDKLGFSDRRPTSGMAGLTRNDPADSDLTRGHLSPVHGGPAPLAPLLRLKHPRHASDGRCSLLSVPGMFSPHITCWATLYSCMAFLKSQLLKEAFPDRPVRHCKPQVPTETTPPASPARRLLMEGQGTPNATAVLCLRARPGAGNVYIA